MLRNSQIVSHAGNYCSNSYTLTILIVFESGVEAKPKNIRRHSATSLPRLAVIPPSGDQVAN